MNDRIVVGTNDHTHDLLLEVSLPDIRQGIVPFIENFGYLYWVVMRPSAWIREFTRSRADLLHAMFSGNDDAINDIDFKLRFIEHAMTRTSWDHPGVLIESNNTWKTRTGWSRMLASGICWQQPWNQTPYLLFSSTKCSPEYFQKDFAEVVRIANDSELRNSLGDCLSLDNPLIINSVVGADGKKIVFDFGALGPRIPESPPVDLDYYQRWMRWLTHSQCDLALSVCTDWPHHLTDSSGKWQVQVMGSTPQLAKPANITAAIYHDIKRCINHNLKLYVFRDHPIDLAELFFWLDTEHTVFHTADWDIVLQQPGDYFSCKEIRISRL